MTRTAVPVDIKPSALVSGEAAYPIYSVSVRWSEQKDGREFSPAWCEGLPDERFWNCTGWDRMEREDVDPNAIAEQLQREWWPSYLEKKATIHDPADLTIKVRLSHREVWCLEWFSHRSFDVGMSDEDVLASFERYVDRCEEAAQRQGADALLMGAEDRWRWHGTETGDPAGERTPPPCRCPLCKQAGIVRIGH